MILETAQNFVFNSFDTYKSPKPALQTWAQA